MEPLLPEQAAVEDLAIALTREAAALGGVLHPVTRRSLADLLRIANTYHSNLIEGHDSRPRDIERAIAQDYASEPSRRALQLEALAHLEVQRLAEERLESDPALSPASVAFLRWLHQEFYGRLPKELRYVSDETNTRKLEVIPGELRTEELRVGRHLPPEPSLVPRFLERFEEAYNPSGLGPLMGTAALGASHHRLLWIHPFTDGNGRVARLHSDAMIRWLGLGAHGLWTVSRGLARKRPEYLRLLEAADAERWNDHDGRGHRSARALVEFCRWFLEVCLDQVRYMSASLDLDTLSARITEYVERRSSGGLGPRLPGEARHLLIACLTLGEVPRGEATRLTGLGERTARKILVQCVRERLLVSDTPKGPVRLGIPAAVAEWYFPQLYPAGALEEES
ncbi:MAG: Fic family protein [Gemmatimonadales bacterium]